MVLLTKSDNIRKCTIQIIYFIEIHKNYEKHGEKGRKIDGNKKYKYNKYEKI